MYLSVIFFFFYSDLFALSFSISLDRPCCLYHSDYQPSLWPTLDHKNWTDRTSCEELETFLMWIRWRWLKGEPKSLNPTQFPTFISIQINIKSREINNKIIKNSLSGSAFSNSPLHVIKINFVLSINIMHRDPHSLAIIPLIIVFKEICCRHWSLGIERGWKRDHFKTE